MKNLTIFQSNYGWTPDLERLDSNISIPGKLGYSWKILREGIPYIRVGENILLCCELQKKLIPTSVVNAEFKTRSSKIQADQGYRIGKKQSRDIKEQILTELFDKAFVTSRLINVWINLAHNLLCIETTSQSTSDDVLTRLIRDLGFEGKAIETEKLPSALMSNLILSVIVGRFELGRSCVLKDTSDNRSISYKNEDLGTEEVKGYLGSGKRPEKLEISFNGYEAVFTLDKNMVVSKITIPDLITERSDFDTEEDYFDNEFTLRTGQCLKIIKALLDVLGARESVESGKAA